jgi:hypothetical protein
MREVVWDLFLVTAGYLLYVVSFRWNGRMIMLHVGGRDEVTLKNHPRRSDSMRRRAAAHERESSSD